MSVQTLLEPDWKRLKGTDGFENGLPEQETGKKKKEERAAGIIISADSW